MTHTGNSPLPSYLHENLLALSKVSPDIKIYFLAESIKKNNFREIVLSAKLDHRNILFIETESIEESRETINFKKNTNLDNQFRGGFWLNSTIRFFLINDFLSQTKFEHALHIENDYILYFDPLKKIEIFKKFNEVTFPLDRIRAIPGIVWFPNSIASKKLVTYISENSQYDDMKNLGDYCNIKKLDALPTIPDAYVKNYSLSHQRYSKNANYFSGIFDAAAIGQYIGGIHWMNDPSDTIFFQNESSDLDLRKCKFQWNVKDGIRYPTMNYQGEETVVLGLHAHSKDINGVSPLNHGAPEDVEDIVTGERIQAIAKITLTTKKIMQFHGVENIKTKEILQIKEDQYGRLFPPDAAEIIQIENAGIIFVYTHLLDYFKKYVAIRLKKEFILITHNSDHEVTINDLGLLNNPYLRIWYAQNSQFSHQKLRAVPIGLENKQWGANKLETLFIQSRNKKTQKNIYVNFSLNTHKLRSAAYDAALKLNDATIEINIPYDTYIKNLSQHRFCLCPRGNGLDTHRFWEAQYLDVIPIILKADWTQAYSGFPLLMIEAWENLYDLDLDKIYLRIMNRGYDRTFLKLSAIKKVITS